MQVGSQRRNYVSPGFNVETVARDGSSESAVGEDVCSLSFNAETARTRVSTLKLSRSVALAEVP